MDSWLGSRVAFSGVQTGDAQAQLLSSDMSELYNEEHRDVSVKPLNFHEEVPHKYTSVVAKRSDLYKLGEPRGLPRYSADQKLQANPRNSMSNRVLLSSQGERIIKGVNKKDLYNPTFLLSSFDRERSRLVREYDTLVKHFEECNTQIHALPFQVNLYEKHEIIKDRALRYLQSKVDTTKLKRDIPAADWNEQRIKKYFVGYQPASAELSHKMITEQPAVAVKKYKNCLYFGGIKGQSKQGYGVLIHLSGRIFEGEFKDDHKFEGFEIDEDWLYIGTFKQGQFAGSGYYKTPTEIRCGNFCNGQWVNQGVTLKDDTVLFQCKNNLFVERNLSGDIYVGDMSSGEKHGMGLEKFTNDDMYIGNYENDRPQGYGEYYWTSVAVFQGQFVAGVRHGNGTWYNKEGDMYEGTYQNDKKSGEGIYRWHNGTEYKGSFANDYRHGYGQMVWADGRIYKGIWTNGIENAKKLPVKRLMTGFAYPNHKRSLSQNHKKGAKLPHLKRVNRSIEVNKLDGNDYQTNKEWRTSTKQLPKGGIKLLFNPNYNFDY